MFKLFKQMISKWNEELPKPKYGVESMLEDDTWDDHFLPKKSEVASFRKFMLFVTSRLGSEASTLISEKAVKDFESGNESAAGAFLNSTNLDLDSNDRILSIYVDWKAYDGIEWQANRILKNLGINHQWSWDPKICGKTVPAGLFNFDDWLTQHGFCLLHIDTGGDDANAFPIEAGSADKMLLLAKKSGISVHTSVGVRKQYGVD